MNLIDWTVLVVVCAAFLFNGTNRVLFNRAWNAAVEGVAVPETRITYDADALTDFVKHARPVRVGSKSTPALEFYVKRILTVSDLFFAVALALATIYLWWIVLAHWGAAWPWLRWVAPPCIAMAVIYLAADISEDLKLSAMLWHGKLWHTPGRSGAGYPEHIDRAEAAAANMLTRIKMLSLILSGIGILIFAVLALIQLGLEKLPMGSGGSESGGSTVQTA